MKILSLAVVSIVLSVAAQFSLKAGMSSDAIKDAMNQAASLKVFSAILGNVYVMSGFVLYGLGAIVWLGVLSKWDVSKAYPMVGLGFVFTAALGFWIGEQVSLTRMIGVVLVCVGVILIGRS